MTEYTAEFRKSFKKDFKRFRSKHQLKTRLENKIEEILKDPSHYKPLRNVLKGMSRIHIGSYVLTFKIDNAKKIVSFRTFKHHDEVYK